jgi:hypothetical protein
MPPGVLHAGAFLVLLLRYQQQLALALQPVSLNSIRSYSNLSSSLTMILVPAAVAPVRRLWQANSSAGSASDTRKGRKETVPVNCSTCPMAVAVAGSCINMVVVLQPLAGAASGAALQWQQLVQALMALPMLQRDVARQLLWRQQQQPKLQ